MSKGSRHILNPVVASVVGVNAALIFEKIRYFQEYHEANGTNEHEGRFWCYYSHSALASQFEYLSSRQIRTALEKLLSNDLVVRGNFNKFKNDRTLWYSVNDNFHVTSKSNATNDTEVISTSDQNVRPLPIETQETNESISNARDMRELVKYLYEFWNAMASVHGLPTVNTNKLNPSRGKTTLIRLAECGGDVAMLEQAISNVPKNPHWLGHNKRNWQADYDWVFKTANFDRVLEYTPPSKELQNAKSNNTKSKGQQYSESNDAAAQAAIQLAQSGARL